MCALELTTGIEADPTVEPTIAEWFGPRAADVDAGRLEVREGLAELDRRGLPKADIDGSIRLVRSVAREDLSTAFSAWAHRMTIDYVAHGGEGLRAELPDLASAARLGATAMAAGTARVLAGSPLPVRYRIDGDEVALDGRIPWASNLIEPFLVITAAAHADDPERELVVAIPGGTPGLEPAPYPELLALNATGSTTVNLTDVRVPRSLVIADDLAAFVDGILARFLLLQGAFCSGLASRALDEAEANLGSMGDAVRPDLERVRADVDAADATTARLAADSIAGRATPRVELLRLRLRWSELATDAVHLELSTTGGRGYLSASATARRQREAAFLPIQAPTEVLLRWLLMHSA